MHTGTLRSRLYVRQSRSLKDKRQVVKSIIDRLRNQFNISIAEVGARDDHQLVILGIAVVAEEATQVARVLELVANFLRSHPVAECLDCKME